jgi:hypothetical protein
MVYIQSDSDRKLPHHFDAACALYGAKDVGQDIRLTSFEEVKSGKFDLLIKNHLFVGSVEFMTEVFKRVGKVVSSMKPAQEVKQLWISDAIDRIKSGQKLFIKPVETKLFSGMVFDKMCIGILEKFPDETEVYVTEPFSSQIVSEWRLYIQNNKVIDAKNYSGDFKITPNWIYADFILISGENFPSCFTLDIAVLQNGETTVVEYNDMWAIGNYGIDNFTYYKLLRERYFEIMRYDN